MRTAICATLALGFLLAPQAQAAATSEEKWPELSLGDLMKVGVETAARKNQSVSNSAAAVFVISAADIKRSGALSIPEVLRLAPGVEAARLSNNKWAVTIRGFNGRMANKLLVLVDGRSIYSSLYGGVIWEAEDLALENIQRIEIIRGSAGLAWGSNAVNGVINIITKRAQDTSGWLVDTHAGTETGKAGVALRYGAKAKDGSAFRVTLDDQRRDGGVEYDGKPAQDQWNDSSLTFRYDRPDGIDTRYLVSGRVFETETGEPWLVPTFDSASMYNQTQYGATRLVPFVSRKSGGDLLGRVERTTDSGGEIRVQTYVEKFRGTIPGTHDSHTTLDLDAQHRFTLGAAHDIVWGGNWRQTEHQGNFEPGVFLTSVQPDVTVTLASLFAQDEWTLVPHTFTVTAGARIERQTFGGTSPQPSLRMLWTPSETQSFWLAWSKTVRSPNVVQSTMGAYAVALPASGTGTLPVLVYAAPGQQSGFGNEKVRTLEAGHRAQWTHSFYSDLSVYISHYDGAYGGVAQTFAANSAAGFTGYPVDPACDTALATFGLAGGPGLCLTHLYGNALPVRTRGLELSTEWNPLPDWRLQLNASRMWLDAGANVAYNTVTLPYGSAPKYQGSLRSSYNVTENRHFDFWLRRIGALAQTYDYGGISAMTPIGARTELDLRYAENIGADLEVSLVLQNLLSKNEIQFHPDYMPTLPVVPQRTIYVRALWRNR